MQKILDKAAQIRLVIFDVDGVLTDRKIYFADNGHEYKAFNSHDGFGIKMLQQTGVAVAIITTRHSSVVERRMQELGVTHVYQGYHDKLQALAKVSATLQLTYPQIAYVGDDLPDLPVMRQVGLGIAVADAAPFLLEHAAFRTHAAGGKGAAREVCELIMQAQNTLSAAQQRYL